MVAPESARRPLAPVAVPALIALVVLVADQVTKWLIVRELGPEQATHRFWVLRPAVALQYVENRGGAFGVFQGQTVFLTVMALVVIGALVLYYRRLANPSPWLILSLGLLLGGALGNLLDRVRLGYVVDFVAIGPWPNFNVADSAVTLGVLLIAWATLTGSQPVVGSRPDAAPLPPPPPAPNPGRVGGCGDVPLAQHWERGVGGIRAEAAIRTTDAHPIAGTGGPTGHTTEG